MLIKHKQRFHCPLVILVQITGVKVAVGGRQLYTMVSELHSGLISHPDTLGHNRCTALAFNILLSVEQGFDQCQKQLVILRYLEVVKGHN